MRAFLSNPFFRFLIKATTLYVGWYMVYEYLLKPHTLFDDYIIHNLVVLGEKVLEIIGYDLIPYTDLPLRSHIGITGPEGPMFSKGVTIGAPCDGAVLFALFIVFVVSFPGKLAAKIWFIPCGLLAIHLLNVLRVAALAIVVHIDESWLAFNHDYTFTIIVYAFVFWLWWLWIKKFSPLAKVHQKVQP
ncbi:MAG: exosortase X [Flavobacteriales bacterium]